MRLGSKFLAVNALVLVLGCAVALQAQRGLRAVEGEYIKVAEQTLPAVQALEDLRLAVLRIVSSTSEYAFLSTAARLQDESVSTAAEGTAGGEETEEPEEDRLDEASDGGEGSGHEEHEEELIDRAEANFAEALGAYDRLVDRYFPDKVQIRELVHRGGVALLAASAQLRAALAVRTPRGELLEIKERLEEEEMAMLSLLAEQVASEQQELARRKNLVSQTIADELMVTMLAAILALGLAAAASHVVGRSITQRLRRLDDAAARVGAGDLAMPEEERSRDEIGMLGRSFHHMVETLRQLGDANTAALRALRTSETRLRDIAEAASDWLWETDASLRLTYVSERFAEVTGRRPETILGGGLDDMLTSLGEARERAPWREPVAARQPFRSLRCEFTDAAGGSRICELAGRPVLSEDGQFLGYRGTAADITAAVEAQSRARYLALHDSLTGLPNRLVLAERLDQALAEYRRQRCLAAVLCIDLDHFKEINDTLGHAVGDQLLKEVAARLQATVRETDTVARMGGDEFAIVQTRAEQPGDAEVLCHRLLDVFATAVRVDGHDLFVGISIGVALIPEDGEDPPTLLKSADIALYRAKAEGRGAFRFFAPGMDAALQARKAMEHDLRDALGRGELEMHYQPLVDVPTGRLAGVEALMRWHHPERGWVSPGEFIPVAEVTGMIFPLGEWALRTACSQAKAWPGLTMSVNLSPVQFRHSDLVGLVRRVLEATGLEPRRLELEITEGVLLQDAEAAVSTLLGLKELGVGIAMDDFGTGYSSLSYLHRFPFDKIKIDQSFVRILEQDENAVAIVRAVLSMGRSLGMQTTAEGVETGEQLAFLRAEGCDQAQGYKLGRPQPASSIAALLAMPERIAGAKPDGPPGRAADLPTLVGA